MILVVCPNAAIDVVARVDRLEPGSVHRCPPTERRAGGKGLNVARALAGLDARATVIGFAGGETGDELCRRAASEGIDLRPISMNGSTRTCFIAVESDTARQTVINESGPLVTSSESARFIAAAISGIAGASVIVLSGSLPPGMDPDAYARIARHASRVDVPVIIDATGDPLASCLSSGIDLVKINADEARIATGESRHGLEGAIEAARGLVRMGARCALVTMGADGAVLVGSDVSAFRAQAPTVASRNAVGAGDAATAGVAMALAANASRRQMLTAAVAAGSAGAIHGFGMLEATEFERLRPLLTIDEVSS